MDEDTAYYKERCKKLAGEIEVLGYQLICAYKEIMKQSKRKMEYKKKLEDRNNEI